MSDAQPFGADSWVDSELVKTMAADALEMTSDIIEKHGPRLAGSQACLESAETIADKMERYATTDIHDFKLHPAAFLGFIRVMVGCYWIGVLFMWFNLPIVSLGFQIVSIVVWIFEYVLYYHFTDVFYPTAPGKNVVGTVEPTGEVENVVVFSGHHDSANIFNLYEDGGGYQVREIRSLVSIILFTILSGTMTYHQWDNELFAPGFPTGWVVIIAILGTIGCKFTYVMWGFLNEVGTPGAGDNLVSVSMAVQIAKYFSEHKLSRTRVMTVSFDAEESGLRGSRAFWKKYADDMKGLNAFNLNSDCPYYANALRFITRDINLTVGLDEKLAKKCMSLASDMDIDAITCTIPFLCGGTDAGEAARAGIRATSILSIPFTNVDHPTVYHTRDDVVSSIEPRAIEQILSVVVSFAEQLDSGALII